MSWYIEFFAAPHDAAAAAVRKRGPAEKYPFVAANDMYFDADDAMLAWRNQLTGRTDRDGLRVVADFHNDGSAVFAMPDDLVTELIGASDHQLREVADVWVAVAVADGAEFGVEAAVAVLSEIAELARTTADSGDRVYCWVCL